MDRLGLTYILTIALFSATLARAELRGQCLNPLVQILYFTMEAKRQSSDVKIARLIKNDPVFREWLASKPPRGSRSGWISNYEALDASTRERFRAKAAAAVPETVDLTQLWEEHGRERHEDLTPKQRSRMNAHARKVLNLKAGDTVVFGEKRFVLGDLLGAGNSTHIFRIADQPGKVIRIPFSVEELASQPMSEYLFSFDVKRPHPSINQAQVIEVGQGYAVVQEVNGSLNGVRFLEQFDIHIPDAWVIDENQTGTMARSASLEKKAKALRKKRNELDAEKMEKLRDQLEKNQDYDNARQFVWDEQLHDWFMVDWE